MNWIGVTAVAIESAAFVAVVAMQRRAKRASERAQAAAERAQAAEESIARRRLSARRD